ncbi:hypothetical protein [Pseudonocardia sp. N23]|uniref:hypothetical protein n=1 Tax=Pseudonocardia sp. N23 TaxID=1987376 RepID=UPI000C035EFD|nr:hypothetical protein [Pseudonocardia sp. N23]GAY08855.1 hypothetical protein TOK_2811 [Pseudonocardia sp. N23]
MPRDASSFDAEKVLAVCRDRLSSYKVPAELVVTDDIPRTGSALQQRLTGESS